MDETERDVLSVIKTTEIYSESLMKLAAVAEVKIDLLLRPQVPSMHPCYV